MVPLPAVGITSSVKYQELMNAPYRKSQHHLLMTCIHKHCLYHLFKNMVLSVSETTLLLCLLTFSFDSVLFCLSVCLLTPTYQCRPFSLSTLQVALPLRSMVRCEQWPTEHRNAFSDLSYIPITSGVCAFV